MRRLTERRIERLKITGKQYSVQDLTPGLALRVSPRGRKTWSLRRTEGQRTVRLTLGNWPKMSVDEARAACNGRTWTPPTTLAQLVSEFVARSGRKTRREDERVLRTVVLPHLGNPRISTIKRRDLVRFIEALIADPDKHAAVNRYWSTLRRMLRWAVEVDLLDADPTSGIRTSVKEQPRGRLITDDELRIIWSKLEGAPKHAARNTIATGLRIGEVVSGRWEDVGGDLWTIPATFTKAQKAHPVPITPLLSDLLAEIRSDSPWMFPSRFGGHLRSPIVGRAMRRFEFEDLRIHDARRLIGSWMAEHWIPLEVIRAVLGHVDGSVTAVHYLASRSMLPRVREALYAWQSHLAAIVASQEEDSRGATEQGRR